MSRIKNFLSSLDKYELAFFVKYKLDSYLPDTQKEIKEYVRLRKLNEWEIEHLITESPKDRYNDNKERCQRCYSDKIRIEKVESVGGNDIEALDGLGGKATYVENEICNVCGLWISDPNEEKPKSFFQKVIDYFFFHKI